MSRTRHHLKSRWYRGHGPSWLKFYSVTPGWWNRLRNKPPGKTLDKRSAAAVLRGDDPDGLVWADDRKPHIYFW